MKTFCWRSSGVLAALCVMTPLLAQPLQVREDAATITVRRGDQAVLSYRKLPIPLPEGVDPVFARTGYIHPLRTPAGGVVTSIYAPDHWHHLGLWHAWVKTQHRERSLDFWNIGGKGAGMRYVKTLALDPDGEEVGFAVEQESFAADGTTGVPVETILRERLEVRVRAAHDVYLVDYDFTQTNVTAAPLELEAYRYGGGIAYRGPDNWNAENSRYLTSDGYGRADGHTTRARWVEMAGALEDTGARGGVVILCHPANRDAPQHVRIWDDGHVFFNYVPAQEHAFTVAPGETMTWRYRVVTFDGELSVERMDALWAAYAAESTSGH